MSSDILKGGPDQTHTFTVTVNDIPLPVNINLLSLIHHLTSAGNKFVSIAGDLPIEIKSQVNHIVTETGTASQKIICIVFFGILILFILLVFTIFIAMAYRNSPYVIPSAVIISLFFIIMIAIIIYIWAFSIYSTSITNINRSIAHINDLIKLANQAIIPSLSCLG